jgi:hypothetical protein
MGLIGKVTVLAGGYYLYKNHQEKKRLEREAEQYRNGPAPASQTRDLQSQSELEFQRDTAPSYSTANNEKNHEATM